MDVVFNFEVFPILLDYISIYIVKLFVHNVFVDIPNGHGLKFLLSHHFLTW